MAVEICAGEQRSMFTASGTTQVKASAGRLAMVIVWAVGTTATLDIYDHASAANNKVYGWVSADGRGAWAVHIPCIYGIRVVVGGTTPGITIVWT